MNETPHVDVSIRHKVVKSELQTLKYFQIFDVEGVILTEERNNSKLIAMG